MSSVTHTKRSRRNRRQVKLGTSVKDGRYLSLQEVLRKARKRPFNRIRILYP